MVWLNAKYATDVQGHVKVQQTQKKKNKQKNRLFSAGSAAEGATFFNSSPFKVLSPQPAKFLKALLPVREESKARKALEARPLLGLEVR